MRSTSRSVCLAAAFTMSLAGLASAQEFPAGPVTLIVPFPPGGSSDQAARPLAAALERVWGQPVVVTNRPGAGSGLGMAEAAEATPDGHTIMIANPGYTLLPVTDALFEREPMITPEQFTPLARIAAEPLLIVVQDDAPWQTFEDFVADAKDSPMELSYASSGPYGATHVPFEMLSHAAEIELNHVPYTGGGPSIAALLSGEVSTTASAPPVLAPQIESGQLRPLAQTGAERVAMFPDVPTVTELGYPVEFYLWAGLFTSAEVPDETVEALRSGIEQAVNDPEYQEDMEALGLEIQYLDGEAFAEFLEQDAARIEEAIGRIGRIE